jgi:hypothetical protein
MVSFQQVYQSKHCAHFPSPPYAPYVLPISSSSLGFQIENKANAAGPLEIPRVYRKTVSFERAHRITTRYHMKTKICLLFEVVQETQEVAGSIPHGVI